MSVVSYFAKYYNYMSTQWCLSNLAMNNLVHTKDWNYLLASHPNINLPEVWLTVCVIYATCTVPLLIILIPLPSRTLLCVAINLAVWQSVLQLPNQNLPNLLVCTFCQYPPLNLSLLTKFN